MKDENVFKSIGLTSWETQAYKALIEIGESTTGPLVKRSGIPQSKIYAVLDMLQEKGLVNHLVKNNIKHYCAVSPDRIMSIFHEKEKDLKIAIDSLSIGAQVLTSVELFEGLKAIRTFHASLLSDAKKGEILYGYSRGDSYSEETNEFYHWWGERKRISGLKDQLLIHDKAKKEFLSSVKKEQLKYVKSKTRFTKYAIPTDTMIFKDYVIFYHWLSPAQIICIKNEEIAKRYKEFFLQLWDENQYR